MVLPFLYNLAEVLRFSLTLGPTGASERRRLHSSFKGDGDWADD